MRSPLEQWVGEKTGLRSRLSAETLEAWQFARLREQLLYAREHSPYYSEQLRGVDLERVRTRDSLSLLPFTPPQALREEPQKLLCIGGGSAPRIVSVNTSGSSGDTKRVWFSAADLERTVDFFARGMTTMVRAGQTVMILLSGPTPDSLGDLLCRALTRIDVRPLLHGPVRDLDTAKKAAAEAHCLIGLPAQLNRLCLCAPELRPLSVLLTADYVPRGIAENIKRVWGSAVFTHYGMSETGFGFAVQCASHEAYHLRDAEFIAEIIDPASGRALPDGEWGELVISSLLNEAMPLVRYRSGDITRRISKPCACGGILPRLDHVKGRASNAALQYSIHGLDEALFHLPGLLDYRAELLQGGGLRLTLDSLAPVGETEITRALRREKIEPAFLELRQEDLPLFSGPAKRNIFTTEVVKQLDF